jgi:phytoene synthase
MGGLFYRIRRHRVGCLGHIYLGDCPPQKRKAAAQTPARAQTPLAQSNARPNRRTATDTHGRCAARPNAATVMQHSRAITKKSASNLALAFILLPKQKRDAMSALYAFCREVDDVADDESVPAEKRRTQLSEWRDDVKRACENQSPQFVVNRELQPVIKQFHLPFGLFDELIKGCEMDLEKNRYEDFEALEKYCYHVASVVGLLSIEIFGYKNAVTRDYAIYLGKALQLTNILRDVKTDAERKRIYLPQSELKKFGVTESEILDSKYSEPYFALAVSVAGRAKDFYLLALKTLPAEDRKSMVAAELMGAIYWQLLQKLEREKFNVFGAQPLKLSKPHKLALIFQSWLRFISGVTTSNYGTP